MKHSRKISPTVLAVAGLMAGAMQYSADADAARKVCDDGGYPPCDTGGGEETTANSLSRPTIVFSGGGLTNVACGTDTWSPIQPPAEPPPVQNGFSIDPELSWFVQGVHKWQAPCLASSTINTPVIGAWGDNLTGDAKLKVGSPIRVELVLSVDQLTPDQPGYDVLKLQPELLDRESAYGTAAYSDESGEPRLYYATPIDFVPGVYDHQANLRIEQVGGTWIFEQPATAEINAKGIVVYGYNLRVPTPGQYRITYTLPNVDLNGADAGECGDGESVSHSCSLSIMVGGGGRPR
ncbi:MAG: hypothetical protein RL756_1847 [Pseudomonadota bacterium]|jgi:hypothetical protein